MSEEATRRRNIAAAAPVVPLMRRPFRNFTGWQGLPVDTTEEFTADDVKSVVPRLVAIRGPERTYPADPAVWLNKHKMTQTEVALRLANYLLAQKLRDPGRRRPHRLRAHPPEPPHLPHRPLSH